jgi:hypothetical protein
MLSSCRRHEIQLARVGLADTTTSTASASSAVVFPPATQQCHGTMDRMTRPRPLPRR